MKTKLLLLSAAFICCMQQAQAQSIAADQTSQGIRYPHNNVQMNVTSLLFKNYNFSYERLLGRKISVVASYRTMPSTTLGEVPVGKKIFEKLATDDDRLKQTTASNTAVTAEIRFYGGRHPGARGFYFSLYGRYADLKGTYPYEFEDGTGKLSSFPLNTQAKGIAGGVMIGAQWLIAKRVVFNWHILGAHYGSLNGSINGVADLSGLSGEDQQEIQDDINGSIMIGSKQVINATVNNNGVQGTVKGPFVGLRAGLSLGIAF